MHAQLAFSCWSARPNGSVSVAWPCVPPHARIGKWCNLRGTTATPHTKQPQVDVEGFEVELTPTLKRVALAHKPVVHLSIHSKLRKFTTQDWDAIADLISVFPTVLEPAGGRMWRPVAGAVREAVEGWAAKASDMELLLAWPGTCSRVPMKPDA